MHANYQRPAPIGVGRGRGTEKDLHLDTEDQPQPEPPERRPTETDQQRFDAEMARDTARALPILGGLGILAAVIMSIIALINSGGGSTTTTVTVPSAPTAGKTTGGEASAQLKGDSLGRQLFVVGDPAGGDVACGSCHTMKAARTVSTVGPNLDKELTQDPPSATRESIVEPNKEIAAGYSANVMPKTYGTALDKHQLAAVVNYVYHSTNTKAKAKQKAGAATSP